MYTDRATAGVFKYFDDSAHMFKALYDRPVDYLRMLFGIGNDTPEFLARYYAEMNNWERHFESNLYNDAHTIIRYNAVVRLISFGEFHVHTVVSAFLSLTGMVGIYRAFVGSLPGLERILAVVVFLLAVPDLGAVVVRVEHAVAVPVGVAAVRQAVAVEVVGGGGG